MMVIWKVSFLAPKADVIVNLSCKLDWIYSQLRSMLWGTTPSVKNFLDQEDEVEKCRWTVGGALLLSSKMKAFACVPSYLTREFTTFVCASIYWISALLLPLPLLLTPSLIKPRFFGLLTRAEDLWLSRNHWSLMPDWHSKDIKFHELTSY